MIVIDNKEENLERKGDTNKPKRERERERERGRERERERERESAHGLILAGLFSWA